MGQRGEWEGPVERRVLVTGANAGIGLATTLHLADLGFRVIGSVRGPAQAGEVEEAAARAGAQVETVVFDVTDPAGYEDLVPALDLWALVNNAGVMHVGTVEDVPLETVRQQFDTLVFGAFRLAQLALPAMRRRGEGRIVNVSSAAAHATGPLLAWYGAAKHALGAVTDAFRAEVAGWGIDVVAVEPGAVRTAIWDKAEVEMERRRPLSHTPQAYERALALVRSLRPRMPGPEVVAAVIGEALRSGRPRPAYRIGWDASVLPQAARLLPAGAKDRVLRAALRL